MKDRTQTSSRLRDTAKEMIALKKRPVSPTEVITYIRNSDGNLKKEIESKCSDYVRIILSVTSDKSLTKYRALISIPGVDERSTFYGLASETYPKDSWQPVLKKEKKRKSSKNASLKSYVPKPRAYIKKVKTQEEKPSLAQSVFPERCESLSDLIQDLDYNFMMKDSSLLDGFFDF